MKVKSDQMIIKSFDDGEGNTKIKIILFKSLRPSGYEAETSENDMQICHHGDKMREAILRAKERIFELAFCNPWQFFFTGTLDPAKYDRCDLDTYHKDLTRFLRDEGARTGTKYDFLLIPELHSDGKSWHMHGFISGIPTSELREFDDDETLPYKLRAKILSGDTVFDYPRYRQKFGFCDLEPVRNKEAVSKYVTKYCNKNLGSCVTEIGAHLYYHSRGLRQAEHIYTGYNDNYIKDLQPSYESEFCKIFWFNPEEEKQ